MKSLLTANFGVRRLTLSVIPAALAFAVSVLVLALASPAHANAPCGRAAPTGHTFPTVRVNDAAFHGPANQRSGSSAGCPSPGALQPTDDAYYFCYTWDANRTSTWTYLQNIRTGVYGWVLDSLLRNNGSMTYCGF
jgi:hypothetical protein